MLSNDKDDDLHFYSQSGDHSTPFDSFEDPYTAQTHSSHAYSQPPDFMSGSDEMHYDDEEPLNDPPFLEEMGIDLGLILGNTRKVLVPFRISPDLLREPDLAGPLVYCITLGLLLLMNGKIHFGYIYGMGVIGCLGMYTILNLMSEVDLDIHKIVSVLGYCMLPIVLLSAVSIPFDLSQGMGFGVAVGFIIWATFAATVIMESIFGMREQRYLIAYPIGLLYTCFALLTIF